MAKKKFKVKLTNDEGKTKEVQVEVPVEAVPAEPGRKPDGRFEKRAAHAARKLAWHAHKKDGWKVVSSEPIEDVG